MDDVITTEYDGCGKCLVGVRRLSRKSESTNSPEKQLNHVLAAVASVGGHVIAWADDWEVSGATDPLTRPGLGPWLRGEAGPYCGIVGAAVDRIGRNQRDVLNTAYMIHESGRLLVTYGHDGPWDLNDPADEMRLSMESFGAQMELRMIQKRNREEAKRARDAGQPRGIPSYGYRYVRLTPTGRVDHVEIDPVAAEVIRDVAQRILTDETGQVTPQTEAARLTRAGVPSPRDHRAVMYGREPKGAPWSGRAIAYILTTEASLGYLLHGLKPVIGNDGHPRQIAPPLWDSATREALIAKTSPKRQRSRAPKGVNLLSGVGYCGSCGQRLHLSGRVDGRRNYVCTGRVRGIQASQGCRPAPAMDVPSLNAQVVEWFLDRYGAGEVMRREFDPGTGYAVQIAKLKADRQRLRDDRSAGLYDSADDAEWYRVQYTRMGEEISRLSELPERPAGMRMMPTGRTVAQDWHAAPDDAARREMLMEFDVRVTLFSREVEDRVRITGMNLYG